MPYRVLTTDQLPEFEKLIRSGHGLLVDIRETGEFQAGHLPLAVSRPLSQFDHWCDELDKDKAIIVYCRTTNRSRRCATMLTSRGFPDVMVLEGGYVAWASRVR